MNFFCNENLDVLLEIHNEPEQIERQERISQINVSQIDKKLKKMITDKADDYDEFEVTLENCTCKDFIFRHKPCKHMYKLANELGIFVKKNERSKNLIVDFSKGYSDGWKFIIRPCNYSDLDIYLSTKKFLTQGKRYNFQRGELFFDNIAAYEEIWENALKKVNFCLQIDSVTETITIPEIIFNDGKFVSQFTPIYGTVEFSIYKKNEQITELEKIKNFSCFQDEFVELLKNGEFADLNGEIHKIC